ncbi:hypothetical protein FQZ97_1193870 [compost metagenome]
MVDRVHVPARGQGQGDRENRAVAVDHVIGEEHRDLQPAAHGRVLHRTVFIARDGVERATDVAGGDFLANHLPGHFRADADQAQLADLLLDGHLLHQVADEGVLVLYGGWQVVG